jgi:hypothetical protein
VVNVAENPARKAPEGPFLTQIVIFLASEAAKGSGTAPADTGAGRQLLKFVCGIAIELICRQRFLQPAGHFIDLTVTGHSGQTVCTLTCGAFCTAIMQGFTAALLIPAFTCPENRNLLMLA